VLGIEPHSLQTSPLLNSWPQHFHQIQYLFLKAINSRNFETVGVTDRAGFYTFGAQSWGWRWRFGCKTDGRGVM